jgi:pantothenate synthetase
MKTKEEILEKHCPSMNNLYLDNQGRNFRDRIIKAMEEYASQQTAEKDREIADLKEQLKRHLPEDCVRQWDEVKFCDVRQGDGWQCKRCAN